ncbi:MAG: aldehyde dehydrogenase [Erysipelotrichaceae bacterium]|nr:aldehyde dehydrogenase [Erysipelotrichaceae bacterium]
MNGKEVLNKQKAYFKTHVTHSYTFRMQQLHKLEETLKKYEQDILDALKKDLNKSHTESFMTELSLIYGELSFFKKKLKSLMKTKNTMGSLVHFYSKNIIMPQPHGCVLILSPWNYPFQLSFVPLIGAIAAGNCVVLKPSNYAQHSSLVIKTIITECFIDDYVTTCLGNRVVNQDLLDQAFDYIFFTGSVAVGKVVMEKASKHLTPITLELGGKSPCIIDESAKIDLAAKRIVWGKLINAGQTCVAVDYIYIHHSLKDDFVKACSRYVKQFWKEQSYLNMDYPKIINENHFNRLCALLKDTDILYGGRSNPDTLQLEFTLVNCKDWNHPCMQEEIFGPIIPVISYEYLDEVIDTIYEQPTPLACYIFSQNKTNIDNVLKNLPFGGGCINDTLIHVSDHNLPFGGLRTSGLGRYHGKYSFETFSHYKGMISKTTLFDVPLRYPPYTNKFPWIKKILSLFS